MKQKFWLLSLLITVLITYSCGSEYNPGRLGLISHGYAEDIGWEQQAIESTAEFSENNIAIQRKVIKQGDISFETSDAKKARAAIEQAVTDYKGYISQDNINNYGNAVRYRLEIRVPADSFDQLLAAVSQSAGKIESKNITILDVTEEFVDIEARIKTKKELEERYKELLKKANSVNDILSIEKQIGDIRTEIESVEGRMKYLTDKISYSTLTISFYEPGETGDSTFGFGSKVCKAVKNGWQGLLWFLIGLTGIWPFLLIAAAVLIVIRGIRKRRKAKNRAIADSQTK